MAKGNSREASLTRPEHIHTPDIAPASDHASDWHTTVWVLVAIEVLVSMGVSVSHPIVPLFLEDELGLSRGREVEIWAGVIVASNFLTAAVFGPIWGTMADRRGRRLMVLRSTLGISIFSSLAAIVTNPYQLLGVRLMMGVLAGYMTAATALIGAIAPRERLGYALGMLATGQVIGLVLGPLIGGVVSSYLGYRMAFLSTGVLALIGFVLALTLLRENFVPPSRDELATRPGLLAAVVGMARSRDLMPVLVVLFLTRVTGSGVSPMTSLFVRDLNVPEKLVPTIAGLAFSVSGLGSAISAPILGRLSDRIGSKRVLVLALLGSALFYLPQAFVTTGIQFLALRFIVGLLDGGTVPAAHAMVGRFAPCTQQSVVFGLTSSATSAGSFTGPLISGVVAASFGLRTVFVYTAAIAALNAAWVIGKVRERSREGTASGGVSALAGG